MNPTSRTDYPSFQTAATVPRVTLLPFNPVLSVGVRQQSVWAPRPSEYKDLDANDEEFSPFGGPAAPQPSSSTPCARIMHEHLEESFAAFKSDLNEAAPWPPTVHLEPQSPSSSKEAGNLRDAQNDGVRMAACDVEYITAWSTFVTIDTESERGQTPAPSTPLVLARSLYSTTATNAAPESPSASTPGSLSPAARAVHRFVSLRYELEHDACARALPARQAAADYISWVVDDILPRCECCRRDFFHPR